jgi:hypothetical protein
MRKQWATLFAVGLAMLASTDGGHAQDKSALGAAPAATRSGVHDFDFEFGSWRVHHRVKRACGEWVEYDGTCTTHGLMGGAGNVEEHTINRPDGVSHGVALRAYDAKTGLWAIWWVDGRAPHGPLDPPTVGRFENGVGTFYWDGVVNGKPVRTRFIWSHITPTAARWEQANSYDAGKTWEPNWIMEFQRTQAN